MANILNIVQYIVLHPLFSTKAFLIKLFKQFEEQGEDFERHQRQFSKNTWPYSFNLTKPLSSSTSTC